MGIAMMEPSLPIWMYETMNSPEWQQGIVKYLDTLIYAWQVNNLKFHLSMVFSQLSFLAVTTFVRFCDISL